MKKNVKIKVLATLFVMTTGLTVYGQFSDIGKFVTGGASDGQKILQKYISPYTNALGYDLNAGWYNTAKVHKLLGFDLTFTGNVAVVPSADKTFDLSKLSLSQSQTGIAPTIAGKSESGPQINYYASGSTTPVASYKTPKGFGFGYIPAPMAQLSLGLVKGTEIIGRFVPTISYGKAGKIGLWGIGVKHSLKQWIPVIDRVPFLNLSVMGGYTQLHSVTGLDVTPEMVGAIDETSTLDFDNQTMDFKVKSFTANVLVSVDIPVVTFYAAAGISNTKTDLKLLGNYPVPTLNSSGVAVVEDENVIQDPISITIKGKNGSVTKPRLNAGIKFKMAVVTLHFEYTYANYSIGTVGLGFTFR
jgi:hypothetical protein